MKINMARIQIVGLKTELDPTINALQRLGCVQIEDISEQNDISIRPMQSARETVKKQEQLASLVSRIDGLMNTMKETVPAGEINDLPIDTAVENCVEEAERGVESLSQQVQTLVAERDDLQARQTSLPRYQQILSKLLTIIPESARKEENMFTGVLVGRQHQWVLDALTDEIMKITAGQGETASKPVDDDTLAMIIIFPRETAAQVEKLLGQKDISRLRLPENVAGIGPEEAVEAIRRQLEIIPKALTDIQSEITQLAQAWLPRLQSWHFCLRNRLEKLRILEKFGETEQTFVLVGWTPQAKVEMIREKLNEASEGKVVVDSLPFRDEDYELAPVVLQNPAPARPFESLTLLLNLPRYQGIDPTLLMAVFLPIFFGMILGDAGYGLVLLLICFYGLHRFKAEGTLRNLIKVLAIGSVWSVVFGLLYGEIFGTLGEEFGFHALWLERGSAEQVQSLLLFTIGVGAVHIVLGLLLGLREAFRQRSRSHMMERGGMLVGLAGLFLIVATAVEQLPQGFMTPSVAILIVGVVILSASQGWLGLLLGPIEFLGLIGNILSYLRIAAIGLASVYVARLANDLAGSFGSIVIGVIVAVLIHALNIVLGAFSPTIHSMRLHYVEFYRRFYEGGGRPFKPFIEVDSRQ
ncbi:MAG: V-type ATP synthase subunit I [Candidatus Promineifilaceae bacterium]